MPSSTPDWIANGGGNMWVNADASNWVVFLNSEPQYMLTPCPAAGKVMCQVKQTNNGKRLESGNTYPGLEDAVRGGLEDLRKVLGWEANRVAASCKRGLELTPAEKY